MGDKGVHVVFKPLKLNFLNLNRFSSSLNISFEAV